MNVVIAQLLYVGIRQSRKTTEHEDIPDNGSFIIGDLHVHDRLQFRFGQETAVAIFGCYPESGKRVGSYPSVVHLYLVKQLHYCPKKFSQT